MKKNKKTALFKGNYWGATVVGDAPYISDTIVRYKNTAQNNARKLKNRLTPAEIKLESILNELNNGVLQEKFLIQWAFADKWILDFFFYENRLGIEVDGCIHDNANQKYKDIKKEKACLEWDITLIRISNSEVFGDRNDLINKLRKGWRKANIKIKNSPFAMKY